MRRSVYVSLACGAALRLCLLVYGVHHDATHALKYTDVDYNVFTDAARYIYDPQESERAVGRYAPTWLGDPYARETYRYTPLLALALIPNVVLHPAFGKVLFATADLAIGYLLSRPSLGASELSVAATWTLNPLVAVISTRGNAESLIGLMVVGSLEAARRGRWSWSAVWLGLAVHLKVYPVIYGAAVLSALRRRPTLALRYSVICFSSFMLANAFAYALWGDPFVEHTFLYHIHRLDHRHNFSPYFYPLYLASARSGAHWSSSPLFSFVPQIGLVALLGFTLGDIDLRIAWFAQTVAFVTFNKVCTSQYFMWYIWLLPPALSRWHASDHERVAVTAAWIGAQAIWLAIAYRLEVEGESVYRELWLASLLFLVVNAAALVRFLYQLR